MSGLSNKYEKEEALLAQIKEGDESVLNKLYEEYREPFKAFLMRIYKCNPENALEVYPETFSRFFFNIRDGKLEPPLKSSLKTYLFAIGKFRFQKRFFDKYNEQRNSWDDNMDIEQAAEAIEMYDLEAQKQLVTKLLGTLGEACRKLLDLIFLKEYHSEAVAKEMGIPSLGAVRKRKHDCLQKLRKQVQTSDDFQSYI